MTRLNKATWLIIEEVMTQRIKKNKRYIYKGLCLELNANPVDRRTESNGSWLKIIARPNIDIALPKKITRKENKNK